MPNSLIKGLLKRIVVFRTVVTEYRCLRYINNIVIMPTHLRLFVLL